MCISVNYQQDMLQMAQTIFESSLGASSMLFSPHYLRHSLRGKVLGRKI